MLHLIHEMKRIVFLPDQIHSLNDDVARLINLEMSDIFFIVICRYKGRPQTEFTQKIRDETQLT